MKLSEEALWVIEAKADRRDIDEADDEARNYYAKRINDLNSNVKVKLATGLAGNDDEGRLRQ